MYRTTYWMLKICHEVYIWICVKKSATSQKTYYDRAFKPTHYKVGDWVWHWYSPTANKKLGLGWTGLYLIINQISDVTYSIQKSVTSPIINVHVDHLKPYESQNQSRDWLNNLYESNVSDISDITNTNLPDIPNTENTENSEIGDILEQNPTSEAQSRNIHYPEVLIIRSRRECIV